MGLHVSWREQVNQTESTMLRLADEFLSALSPRCWLVLLVASLCFGMITSALLLNLGRPSNRVDIAPHSSMIIPSEFAITAAESIPIKVDLISGTATQKSGWMPVSGDAIERLRRIGDRIREREMAIAASALVYFAPEEFTRNGVDWWYQIDPRLLVMLDVVRFMWGSSIEVSQDDQAVGRFLGNSPSQHNVERWGECRAVDVLPSRIVSRGDAQRFFDLAVAVGFTGVGVYPHWHSGVGFHLDTRRHYRPGDPATWGALMRQVVDEGEKMMRRQWVSAEQAIGAIV